MQRTDNYLHNRMNYDNSYNGNVCFLTIYWLIQTLTAVVNFALGHLRHLGMSDVLVGRQEEDDLPLLIFDGNDVQQAPEGCPWNEKKTWLSGFKVADYLNALS